MATFSESWHRIGGLHAQLRPQVRVHRQFFRGERWHLLHDPFNNQFFRLRPEAYAFVARLTDGRTVEQAWRDTLESRPDDAPGQQDVVELLAQLYHANLLIADVPADTAALFLRQRKRVRRETGAKLLGAMFARFPLWDPDDFLNRIRPVADRVFSRAGSVVWLIVVALGLNAVIRHAPELAAQGQRVLSPSNLPLLLIATVVLKVLHEFGHMCLCKKFGGEVHATGIMLMLFTPMPYADTTAAWGFRRRRERVLVGAGGMIVETFLAALAALAWAGMGDGAWRDLMFNAMLIGSVSTLLFNLNPLLRFDGYYIFSDLAGVPNLYQRSLAFLRFLAERYGFGLRKEQSPAVDRSEAWILGVYGVAGAIYRAMLFGSILLFIWDQFLLAGLIMGLLCVTAWVIIPAGKLILYLSDSAKLNRRRARAVGVTLGALAALILAVRFLPLPDSVRAPGTLEAERYTVVSTETAGRIVKILTESGATVTAGQPLLQLEDPTLASDLAESAAQLAEARARQRQALSGDRASLSVIDGYLIALEARATELQRREKELLVTAATAGVWVAPQAHEYILRWVPRGVMLGEIIDPSAYHLSVLVPATRAPRILAAVEREATVRLLGQPSEALIVEKSVIVAASPEKLVTPGGENGGGDSEEARRKRTAFEVRATVRTDSRVSLLHGLRGEVRFSLPAQPLWRQLARVWHEIFEKRAETT